MIKNLKETNMITRIYHKKDEQFNIEFFQDKECRQAFNFENVKKEIAPLFLSFQINFGA